MVPDAIAENWGTFVATAVTVAAVAVIFVVYRVYQSLWAVQARMEKVDKERESEIERQEQESKFLAEKLAEAEAKLKAEIKGKELDYDSIEFEEGKEGILGQGAFGIVRRAKLLGEVVAVKKIKVAASRLFWREEDAQAVEDFVSEINVMTELRHPNVIYFFGGVWTRGVQKMCRELRWSVREL